MKIKIFDDGIYGAITYLIYDEESKEGAIVDATCCIDEIKNITEKNQKRLFSVFILRVMQQERKRHPSGCL